MIRTGGALLKFSTFICQNDSSTAGDLTFSTTTTVVPVANNIVTPARTTVFAFVHAIIFNAPLMRVKVEPPAAAPLVTATAVMDLVKVTGAAWIEWAETALAIIAVVEAMPRRAKKAWSFSSPRATRFWAAR